MRKANRLREFVSKKRSRAGHWEVKPNGMQLATFGRHQEAMERADTEVD
jgi:hypothetical protein